MDREKVRLGRDFLKSSFTTESWVALRTDQKEQKPEPPIQKPYDADAILVDLIPPEKFDFIKIDLLSAFQKRRSHRKCLLNAFDLEELSFLLWSTQGISGESERLRVSPSGGARNPFETYIAVNQVNGLRSGLYRYLPVEHKLCLEYLDDEIASKTSEVLIGQDRNPGVRFIQNAPVVFIWAAIPYRAEWRYGEHAHKMIAIEAGHICENLYLAVNAIDAGTCAMGAYDQTAIDRLLKIDGEDEYVIYLAPVGKLE